MTLLKRPGYYVEGYFFRDYFHQAHAKACHLAKEYSRPVSIVFLPKPEPDLTNSIEVFRVKD